MIKFGPSGNSEEFYDSGFKATEQAAQWVAEKGLKIFEYSFGKGVRLSSAKAEIMKNAFESAGVELTVHAPYFINLANPDDEMAEKSYGYILSSLAKAREMGAKRVIFHPGTEGKMKRDEAFELVKKRMQIVKELIIEHGYSDMIICPETMGKIRQIGTVSEVCELCKIADFFIPCVDFGHINAREHGSLKTQADFEKILDEMTETLGEKAKKFHIHFSKIEFSKGGEVRHLTFEDAVYGPEFPPLAKALKDKGFTPYCICESAGTQTKDAVSMLEIYNQI